MDQEVSLFKMSFEMQISNVGSEVHRAIRWKNRGDEKGKIEFCKKSIEFLEMMKEDPKNRNRKEELDFRIGELEDYFLGDNHLNTTDDKLIEYYDAFLYDLF